MNIKCQRLEIKRTAHIFTLGDERTANNLWIVCHGYGQLADRLINKFDQLDLTDNLILVPEGISKFYWNGFAGEPVASWMTSRNRLDEIDDYCNYLDQVLAKQITNKKFQKVILFGFSQGCATIWRWVHARRFNFDVLINWAGTIPEDISYLEMENYLSSKELYFVVGRQDPYLTPERVETISKNISDNKISMNHREFNGAHAIDRDYLNQLVQEISE